MSDTVVADASVWVSWLSPLESNYSSSNTWMERFNASRGQFVAPSFLQIEIAASISRKTGQITKALAAVEALNSIDTMQVLPLDASLVQTATDVAINLQMRAGDAIYVALARQMNIPLISWDKDQLSKASRFITTYTPESYPFSGDEAN